LAHLRRSRPFLAAGSPLTGVDPGLPRLSGLLCTRCVLAGHVYRRVLESAGHQKHSATSITVHTLA
jgi:hypothetical protein